MDTYISREHDLQLTKPTRRHTVLTLAAFLLLAFCLFISVKTVFGLFSIDEDTAQSLMLWYGTKAWGLQSIAHFAFTPDNWLLSVVPVNFLTFFLFGPKAELIVFSGWLSYALSALFSAWIAWELQARRAAICIFAVLLCLNLYALGSGFAAYAASHNITNTYGLLALLLALKWLRRPAICYLIAITLLSVMAAVSDPWMLIAYDLPLFGLAFLGLIRPIFNLRRADSALLALAVLIPFYVSKTRLFGLFDFVPAEVAGPASLAIMAHNAIFFIRDLGGMLNLLPNQQTNALLPAIISLILIALAFCLAFLKTLQPVLQHPPRRFFAAFAVISSGILAVFFVVMNTVAEAYSARFILNIVYLAVICFAVTAELGWQKYGLALRALLGVVSAAFFAASLASTYPTWGGANFFAQEYSALAASVSLLKQNGLSYGFGPYHGSHSNAITATSGGTIIIRPAMFDHTTGMIMNASRLETFARWRSPSDVPPQAQNFFVILADDGEECVNLELCQTGVVRQFGKPTQILQISPSSWIYIWPRAALNNLYSAPAADSGDTDLARIRP